MQHAGDPSTAVGYSGGPVIRNAKIYVNYFGPDFRAAYDADPQGFDRVFTAGISEATTPAYYTQLQQYGVQTRYARELWIGRRRELRKAAYPSA